MLTKLVLAISVFLNMMALPLVLLGQHAPHATDTLTEVEEYCKKVESLSEGSKPHVFADVSAARVPTWRQFADTDSLSRTLRDRTPNAVALVWFLQGRIVEVNLSFQSESNDWAKYSNHCFRRDGSLAIIQSTLKTFHGNVSQVVSSSYNKAGLRTKIKTEYFDLTTGSPVATPKVFEKESTPIYKRVEDLPFIKLVR